jgi:hypothetical protein
MGGNVSVQKKVMEHLEQHIMTQTCDMSMADVDQELEVKIEGDFSTFGCSTTIVNAADIKINCDVQGFMDVMTELRSKSEQEQIAELGIGVNLNNYDFKSNFDAFFEMTQTCQQENAHPETRQEKTLTIDGDYNCAFSSNKFGNEMTYFSNCVLDALQKTETLHSEETDFRQKIAGLFGSVGNFVMMIVIVVIILVVLASLGANKKSRRGR